MRLRGSIPSGIKYYLYNMTELIAPGDIYISEYETLQFHKGMPYVIKSVYHEGGKLIATITDKWGTEVLFKSYNFKAKTYTNFKLRHLKALLEFCFNNRGTFMFWRGWNEAKPSVFYSINANEVHSSRGINMEGTVKIEYKFRKELKDPWAVVSTEPRFEFHTKDECINHLFDLLKKDYDDDYYMIRMENMDHDQQDRINLQTYILMSGINTMPQDKKDELVRTGIADGGRHTDECRYALPEFTTFLNFLIFDKKIDDAQVKKYMQEVMKLFMAVPPSYAATAVSKILMGTGKVKTQPVQPFFGIFKTIGLKYDQVFEFVDHVDSFLYEHKVFVKKEDYGTAPEWRDQFEFIGNKAIDKGKLEEFLK